MPFQPPLNNVVVSVKTKYIGNYSNILKAANLNPANTLNPADLVNIYGEVVALPKAVNSLHRDYKGFTLKDIAVGDGAIFRFDVIFDHVFNPRTDTNEYKNMIWYKGKEYWMVDITKLYAVIKQESQSIKMLNSYCMLEDVEAESQIFLPQTSKRIIRAKQATLSQIGNPLENENRIDAFPGDKVLVHPSRIVNYQINDKKFSMVRMRDILGRVLE